MSDLESVDLSQESESEASEEAAPSRAEPNKQPSTLNAPNSNEPSSPRAPPQTVSRRAPHSRTYKSNSSIVSTGKTSNPEMGNTHPDNHSVQAPPVANVQEKEPRPPRNDPIEKPSQQSDKTTSTEPKDLSVKPKKGRTRKGKEARKPDNPHLEADDEDVSLAVVRSRMSKKDNISATTPAKKAAQESIAHPDTEKAATGSKNRGEKEPVGSAGRSQAHKGPAIRPDANPKGPNQETGNPHTSPRQKEAPVKISGEQPSRSVSRGRGKRINTSRPDPKSKEAVKPSTSTPEPSAPPRPFPSDASAARHVQSTGSVEKKTTGAAKTTSQKRKRDNYEGDSSVAPAQASVRNANVTEVPDSRTPAKPKGKKRPRHQASKAVEPSSVREVIRIDDDVAVRPQSGADSEALKQTPAQGLGGTRISRIPGRAEDVPNDFAEDMGTGVQADRAAGSIAAEAKRTRDVRMAGRRTSQQLDVEVMGRSPRQTANGSDFGSAKNENGPHHVSNAMRPISSTLKNRRGSLRFEDVTEGELPIDIAAEVDDDVIAQGSEVVKTMLDQIQRNSWPFLLSQEKICDSFIAKLGMDVDATLKSGEKKETIAFSEVERKALIADRLRWTVGSAKANLRIGIERLLREFAREVAAPLDDGNSPLLLRNEAFRTPHSSRRSTGSARIGASPSGLPMLWDAMTPHKLSDKVDVESDATGVARQLSVTTDVAPMSNVSEIKRFVGYTYEKLGLDCYRSRAILKLCEQPKGMTLATLHELTPFGLFMIRNKIKALVQRGFLVEGSAALKRDICYFTAYHVAELQ